MVDEPPAQFSLRDHLAAIVESSDDAIIGKTPEGVITSWNKGAERLYGYRADEVVGRPVTVLVPPGHHDEMFEILARVRRGERIEHFETIRVTKGGKLLEVSLSVSPIRGPKGDIVGAAAIARDMTERRRSEQDRMRMVSLVDSEERFRKVAQVAVEAIISADERGNIVFFNASAERMFGRSAGEMAGKPLTELMPERYRADHELGLERFNTTGQARVIGRTVELAGRRADGTEFPVELSITNWRTAQGSFFTGIVRDISERKRLEEQLARQSKELAAAYKEMEAFAYSVSHDLRAPLRAVQGYGAALDEDYGKLLDERGRQFLGRITARAQHMDKMLLDILEFSRLGRTELTMKDTDLKGAVSQALSTLEREVAESGAKVTVSATMPRVLADERVLDRILVNLLQNALKFAEKGRAPEVEVGAEPSGRRVRVWVRDNGLGVPEGHEERIWGVFERLKGADVLPGTGIGLAIVKRGAERMGGGVGVISKTGGGSLFWFELPPAPEANR